SPKRWSDRFRPLPARRAPQAIPNRRWRPSATALPPSACAPLAPRRPEMSPQQFAETHEVFNQVPSLDGCNLYRLDLPLQEWIHRYHGAWAEQRLHDYGALAGGALMPAGFLANEDKPALRSHDRYGNRIDLVEFHPAYHELMRTAIAHG